jgi:hypothetical protein
MKTLHNDFLPVAKPYVKDGKPDELLSQSEFRTILGFSTYILTALINVMFSEIIKFDTSNGVQKLDDVKNNLIVTKGKQTVPTRYNVYKNSKFGKVSKNHSFTCDPGFEQILIFILKSGYLLVRDLTVLLKTHVLFSHLYKMMHWSKKIDFLNIRNPIKNYADQSEIDPNRKKQFLAALLHYDLDIPTLIRFLGVITQANTGMLKLQLKS